METLESSRVCRLCGQQSGISINIFDKNENHVKKINAVLPIMVHEMDLLPKHMCHRCSYKLEEFHKFYVDCLKTDADLKSQLSWMGKEDPRERVGIPMVHIENVKIKIEPQEYDTYDIAPMVSNVNYINPIGSMSFDPEDISYAAYRCRCCCDKMDQSSKTISTKYHNTGVTSRPEINRGNDSKTVKKNPTSDKTFKESNNRSKKTSYSLKNIENVKTEIADDVFVRNLRPRNSLPRQKSPAKFDLNLIKVESCDSLEGRILRPRKGTIDYLGPKRKFSRSSSKNQRLEVTGNVKVKNIASKLRPPFEKTNLLESAIEDRINFTVKQEQLSDFEGTINESATLLRNKKVNKNAAPLSVLSIHDDRITCNGLRPSSETERLKSSRNPRNKSKDLSKDPAIRYKSKYVSSDIYLRSGRVKRLYDTEFLSRKLQKNLRNLGTSKSENLMKALTGIVKENVTASIKLINNNIKHYCEECNTSFLNRELFKLHLCHH